MTNIQCFPLGFKNSTYTKKMLVNQYISQRIDDERTIYEPFLEHEPYIDNNNKLLKYEQ